MLVVGFVYNRKKTATKDAVIEIRVSYDYKKKYLSTGAIKTARMGTESLERVRDLFVFQACYVPFV